MPPTSNNKTPIRMSSNDTSVSESDDFTDYDVISDAADPPSLESSIASIASFNDLKLDSPGPSLSFPEANTSAGPGGSRNDRYGHTYAYEGQTITGTNSPNPGVASSAQSRAVVERFEPPPSEDAKKLYEPAVFSAEDIRSFVRSNSIPGYNQFQNDVFTIRGDPRNLTSSRTVRVYVDGTFENLNVSVLHQLRQAKLSFSRVHLLAGPFTDVQCRAHALSVILPHVERCELVRHVRWVDEVLFDSPVVLSEEYLERHKIDLVVVPEGYSVDPRVGKDRLAGYDLIKSIGKALLTRRTRNVVAEALITGLSAAPTPAMHSSRKLEAEPETLLTPNPQLQSSSLSTQSIPPEPEPSISVESLQHPSLTVSIPDALIDSGVLPKMNTDIRINSVGDNSEPEPPSPREEFGA